jgi:anaerobic selenocysteine-containing dehydrogenase
MSDRREIPGIEPYGRAAVRRNLRHGDRVDLETAAPGLPASRLCGLVAVAYDIPPGSVAAYYPEEYRLAPLGLVDLHSGTPAYKSVPVRLLPGAVAPERN